MASFSTTMLQLRQTIELRLETLLFVVEIVVVGSCFVQNGEVQFQDSDLLIQFCLVVRAVAYVDRASKDRQVTVIPLEGATPFPVRVALPARVQFALVRSFE
jgi:hypothetical protein